MSLRRLAALAPFLWLALFFAAPFVLVAKLSLSDTALAIPPYAPRIDWRAGLSGVAMFLRGLDLNAFDDWVHALVHNEPFMGFGDLFFPMWRIERIAKDEAAGGVPSLCEQVEKRTGLTIQELLRTDDSRTD